MDRVGEQFGNYRLVRFLGEGGFADVYLGEHVHLGTQAAIKILNTQLARGDIEQFRQEARTIAHLLHPNIVRVLEFDVEEKNPFLVMDYAPNGNLRERHARGSRLAASAVAAYVQQVGKALQYAHDEKVIHRDVKPENMLLSRTNEVVLGDFGIALIAQSSRHQSQQDMAGTITYMAPEQIQGKPRAASDQYALGIVAYEWLSGARPFQGSFTEIATQQLLIPPAPLRQFIPDVDPALEQVVMRALHKDPYQRFPRVLDFVQALTQAAGSGNSIPYSVEAALTPPPPPWSTLQSQQTTHTVEAYEGVPHTGMGQVLCVYRQHKDAISSLAWSPDSQWIASASDDRSVQIWSASSGHRRVLYQGHTEEVATVAWSPDGTTIASGGADKTVRIWEATTGRHLVTYSGHRNAVWCINWSPTGDSLASSSGDHSMHVISTQDWKPIFRCKGSAGTVWALAWSPEDNYLAYQSAPEIVTICDTVDGHRIQEYREHDKRVWALAWSPDGETIASAGEDCIVRIWRASTAWTFLRYHGHQDSIIALAWSPDGAYIASAGDDQTVQIWVAASGKPIYTYQGHRNNVIALAWSPDGRSIASAGEDQSVHIWTAP
ncbi:hypothetical protein KDA_45780 [Dictyobacter alpinus]|uniref:Protein kinase domain-containing protein n=1 Tax=Dictyobacter alpinus TaxID=2014873 RepID=A0A402BCN1_9CHLR|nr:serine/threonine-protein kinase [Dictyobacter alpinus]GCE29094.1 hypothetical protein KDA_45780 [Dictyobacter alpinus]